GLAPLLDAILVSEAEGVHKPDPLIFQRALRALGLAAHEAVHVGDHPVNDVAGAHAAGLRTVWLRDNYWPEPPEADATINLLSELPALLADGLGG
ncbi:MAG: HAD family hydrolase, partial [Comamonas sp.]